MNDSFLSALIQQVLVWKTKRKAQRQRSEIVSGSQCVWSSGGLDHSVTPDFTGGLPPNPDHTQPPLPPLLLLRLPAASVSRKQNREATVKQGWMERLAEDGVDGGWVGGGGSQHGEYALSDTFSLFLFSRPVLIISILGHWGSPNIELLLIDQACINKPREG